MCGLNFYETDVITAECNQNFCKIVYLIQRFALAVNSPHYAVRSNQLWLELATYAQKKLYVSLFVLED